MAQKDMQDLLRLLTTGRNKLPMLQAMQRVKSLQTASISPSISSIANTSLPVLTTALSSDEKAAKALISACKTASKKRPLEEDPSSSAATPYAKRTKSFFELAEEPQTPQALEASLELPAPSEDEERIEKTSIYTNRAPLVLAFAVQLLKYTMPEQPLSARLSLAQAVVSANSRSKAVSLGIEKKGTAENEGWGTGQPKVRVMGREVAVLKRGGYEWEGDGEAGAAEGAAAGQNGSKAITGQVVKEEKKNEWMVSISVTSKKSTFIARSISVTSPSNARSALQTLLSNNPSLKAASHNITAFRVSTPSGSIIEDCDDDGESGGGRHLLQLLQSDSIVNVLLVVTRWYGGIFLGPDRWRIMSQVSRDALSQRLRVKGTIGVEALWGLDLEAMREGNGPVAGGGMPVHKPEEARKYILNAFANMPEKEEEGGKKGKKRKSGKEVEREKRENLGLLLGGLDLLFKSWEGSLGKDEIDRRAWGWYVHVRPEVESGVPGWGGKGEVKLGDILKLRRNVD